MDEKEGVRGILASCFIQEENAIVRAESNGLCTSNIPIKAFDAVSKKLKGENYFEFLFDL